MNKIITIGLLLLSNFSQSWGQNAVRYVTPQKGLFVRANESTDSKVIDGLEYGDEVKLLGYKSALQQVRGVKGHWVQISYKGGKRGYVLDAYLSKIKPNNRVRYVNVKSGLNVREKENSTSKVLVALDYGEAVELLGFKSKSVTIEGRTGSWVQVKANGVTGYVFDFFLSVQQPLE